jgi:hypothetical protein
VITLDPYVGDFSIMLRECFFPLTTFKFRRALEPSINLIPDGPRKKALKPAGNLALAFSGGLSSAVLLDLVDRSYFAPQADEDGEMKGGRDHPRNDPTRVWKRTVVVYVEVAGAHGGVRGCVHGEGMHLIYPAGSGTDQPSGRDSGQPSPLRVHPCPNTGCLRPCLV